MTKPTKWVCVQRRLRSAWAFAKSDQSLRFRMKKAWVLSYPLIAHRRLWSDWADVQADLSLRWAQSYFVGFVRSRLIFFNLSRFASQTRQNQRPVFVIRWWNQLPEDSRNLGERQWYCLWCGTNNEWTGGKTERNWASDTRYTSVSMFGRGIYSRNQFHFSDIHHSMNTMEYVQSKWRTKGATLTLHRTHCVHTSINVRKMKLIFYSYSLFYIAFVHYLWSFDSNLIK